MDAGFLRNVLAKEFDRVKHDHQAVESGASTFGRGGGVRGDAVKTETAPIVGEQRAHVHTVGIAGMPGEHGVDIGEQAGVKQVDFPAAALFGGRAVIADGAFEAARLHLLFNSDGGERGRGAQQVVAAAMSRSSRVDRREHGGILLRKAGQRVELAHQTDDGLAAAEGRGEGGGHAGEIGAHIEAIGAQLGLEQRGAFGFVVAELGRLPDLARHHAKTVGVRGDMGENIVGRGERAGASDRGEKDSNHRNRRLYPLCYI